jgi:hypothetical protein
VALCGRTRSSLMRSSTTRITVGRLTSSRSAMAFREIGPRVESFRGWPIG